VAPSLPGLNNKETVTGVRSSRNMLWLLLTLVVMLVVASSSSWARD
jgi:hypothetical protein